MLKTLAVGEFLHSTGNRHLTDLYSPEMEVQVNVAQDDGTRVQGIYKGKRWLGWKNEETGEQWKSFRIPWNAKHNPEYVDSNINFDLAKHVEGIGMTGWNWKTKQSYWFGFDFDSIANHKQGLNDEELNKITDTVYEIPWVTLVRSTSGTGLHLYVHLNSPIKTENHTEHAAVARALLSLLSGIAGYNFSVSVDTCGGVLWVYHRKQEGTNGLTLLKKGENFNAAKIPANWKAHVEVTSGKRKQIKSISENDLAFDELTSSNRKQDLDAEHMRLLKWFTKSSSDRDSWWDSDHNMLVCHTYDLKKAHEDLQLKGFFYTDSSGSSRQNCYAFPVSDGAWVIRRHSPGVQEHPSWTVDPSGWTRCIYNDLAEFTVSAKSNDGIENIRGEYVFKSVKEGSKALKDIGIVLDLQEWVEGRTMYIKEKQDGKLVIAITREANDPSLPGFLSSKNGDRWEQVIKRHKRKREIASPDYLIRHMISNSTEAGWWIFTRKQWIQQNKSNVVTVLLSQQDANNRVDTELMMGKAILNPWELINIPFAEEYPGNRQWNKDAAALSCSPEEGPCPTWMSILEHCGKSLDDVVKTDDWCIQNAIETGTDYLLCWTANVLQRPSDPLPYLFFVGPQNSGKSTYHEAIELLFRGSHGYARADNALINQQGFNGEIAGAVLCVVEETDLRKNKDAANRIKDWVTGRTISINTKYKTVYDIKNVSHWVQCANDLSYCPVFAGDTRIIVIRVDALDKEIPKGLLFELLMKEKSQFLNALLTLELPQPAGRLSMPTLRTTEKAALEIDNSSDLEIFIKDKLVVCSGHSITWEEFYNDFQSWLPADRRGTWSNVKTARRYPKSYPFIKGLMGKENATCLGNVSFDKTVKPEVFELVLNLDNRRLERKFKS